MSTYIACICVELTVLIYSQQSGDKKESERVTKNLIKVIVKIGLLNKNDQFSAEERQLAVRFQRKFQMTALTVISFHQVDFTYDQDFLTTSLAQMREMLLKLVQRHLSDKTAARVNNVFDFFGKAQFLDDVFCADSDHRQLLGAITTELNTLLEGFENDAG